MANTPAIDLEKFEGTDPFRRVSFNNNSDKIDKTALCLALIATYYGNLEKGPITFDSNGYPVSQSITNSAGLSGQITWTFTSTQITERLQITFPYTLTITKVVDLTDLSESYTIQ